MRRGVREWNPHDTLGKKESERSNPCTNFAPKSNQLKFRDLEPEFKPAGHNGGRRLGSHHSDNLASNFTMRLFVVRGEKRSYEWETLRNLSAPTELMRDQ